jgi:hypothetical protein
MSAPRSPPAASISHFRFPVSQSNNSPQEFFIQTFVQQRLDPARYPFLPVPAFWLLVSLVSSMAGGWFTLAARFRRLTEPVGEARTIRPFFSPVYTRIWVNAGGVRLTAADDALYLSVSFLFCFGHPPLRIPWTEILFCTCDPYFMCGPCVVLTLGKEERIPLRIRPHTALRLGILDRVPGGSALEAEPNFDQLPEDFPDSSGKKPS